MPMPINTGYIVDQLEKAAEGGHIAGDVEIPTWLASVAAERIKELTVERNNARRNVEHWRHECGKLRAKANQ